MLWAEDSERGCLGKEGKEEVQPLHARDRHRHSKIYLFGQQPAGGLFMRMRVLLVAFGVILQAGTSATQARLNPYYCDEIHASLIGWVPGQVGASPNFQVVSPTILKQTGFYPYYNKNNIHYDTFDWQVYETEHFWIYYYPEIKHQLERVAGYAESAYQQVSADLRHDLPGKVPLILFKTHSEFEQQNVAPGAAQEGVAAFAESDRRRMLMPIDEPPDRLFGLITHELTHVFQYDIIPQGLIRRSVPLWMNEGHADYERAQWDPLDLMMVRDAAVADIVPHMSSLEGYGETNNPRMIYNLGHAVFEFIEARFGKTGVQGFLFALRKSVIGSGEDAYEEAFQMKPDEFDQSFERYLKDRFKAFRDKERPADYGRNLAPNPEKTPYIQALSIAPSPSGELIAAVTGNRKDGEVDIVLLSSKDGAVVKNLTQGFDKDLGFTYIVQNGERFNTVPWMAWSPKGDRIAYFARTEKERTLILQNIITREIEVRVPLKSVDEPESPVFSPDGRKVAFSALRAGISDIYTVDLESREITNLTADDFFDYGPTYSPDGTYIVHTVRISGNQKLFRLDLATKKKTQLTFAPQDESAAQFLDDHTLVFSSTGTDPAKPLEPDIARNGNIYNIWTLDLVNGELKQYTDALGGTFSPVMLNEGKEKRMAFVTYYKGDWGIHTLDRKEPLHTAASADFGSPGAIIDFQAPLTHNFIDANSRPKKMFENMFVEGIPSLNVMVSNNGDVFGGTAISFGDVLGDQRFLLYADSSAQYSGASRTMSFQWINLAHRFQFALQGITQTQFFYASTGGGYIDPLLSPVFSNRSDLLATSQVRGGTAFGIYPLDRFRRLELSGGLFHIKDSFNPDAQQYLDYFGLPQPQAFRSGMSAPLGAAFVQETTVFREFGPLSGSTMKLAYETEPPVGGSLSSQTIDADARYYQRLATSGVLALRFKGFRSGGANPRYTYFGGNSEMRGYNYLEFSGDKMVFANAELRFPLIEAALTPIGVIGGIRGVFFANMGGGWFKSQQNYQFFTSKDESFRPIVDYQRDPLTGLISVDIATGNPTPIYGPEKTIRGFRLKDGRASYGMGLETFVFGFPVHFDWAWRTLFNKNWEDATFAYSGGSKEFRKPRFGMWIGYDF